MFTTSELPNGIRVLVAPQHETQAATVLVLVPVGSRYESARNNGVSHFIEHLMFKGTERRPTTLALSRELDRVGAEYNAYTSKEYTGYYVKANAEHLDLALDILADMLSASRFVSEEIDRERNVILEEIHLYEDNPSLHIDDLVEEILYRDHPLGRLVSGTRDSMLRITRPAVLAYRDRMYHPHRFVLAVAGNVGEHVLDRVHATFGRIPGRSRRTTIRPTPFRRDPRGPTVRIQWKETAQAHLALGVPTFGIDDARTATLTILANILGGTMSSRLFIAVRERRALAYAIRAAAEAYAETGALVIDAGLDASRLPEAIRVILRELARVRDRGVTAEELQTAKENLEGRIVLSMEESSARAEWYGRQALLRREVLTPEERIARIMAVERDGVHAVARSILRTDRLHLALIGAFKDATPFRKLLRLPTR